MLIFLSTFVLYLYTLAPSITVGDSGEFCASSVILGLPHSPSYPLYCLMGKLATILIPWGSFAFRINLMSAVLASLSVLILYYLLIGLMNRKFNDEIASPSARNDIEKPVIWWHQHLGAALVVILFACTDAFWRSSISAEVFTLNTLFAVLILLSVNKEHYLLASYLFGLGFGNHHTLIFLTPLLIVEIIRKRLYSAGYLLKLLIFFMLGFSIYAYLPIRSYKNPALDWSNPETVRNIWRVISRADYGSLSLTVGEKMGFSISIIIKQITRLFNILMHQYTAVGVFLGIAGWFIGIKEKYKLSRSIFLLWLLAGPGFILLANMPFDSQTEGILERFFILINLFWIFPVFWSLDWIISIAKSKVKSVVLLAIFSLFIVITIKGRFSTINWRDYYLAYDYGRNILRTLKPNSVFFMDGGDDTFYSTAYLCFAENHRRDIELHDRGGLVFKNIYGEDFRRIGKEDKEKRRNQVEKEFLGKKPLYYSTFNKDILPGINLALDGMLYRAIYPDKNKPDDSINAWHVYSLRSVWGAEYYDYRSRALVPVYPYFAAYHYSDESVEFWEYAHKRWPEVIWLNTNLKHELIHYAFKYFQAGLLSQAKDVYNKIIELYPDEISSYVNMGVIEEKENNLEKAKQYYDRALKVNPQYLDAYFNLAVIYWKEENWEEVIKNLNIILKIKPDDARAKYYLQKAQEKIGRKG
ncbi:MAG: DUF2723 domain-containing protein [Endomicrobiales bacterium]|nr:DUF2723 domain-containing protein [Endomicrobiales bacterium]